MSEQSLGETKQARSLTALAAFVEGVFSEGVYFRQRTGMDEELAKRRAQGLPVVYAPLSDTKRRAANAWASEIFLNTAEKTYELRPTPVPEMPETVVQAIAAEVIQEWASVVSPNPPQGEAQLAAVAAMVANMILSLCIVVAGLCYRLKVFVRSEVAPPSAPPKPMPPLWVWPWVWSF